MDMWVYVYVYVCVYTCGHMHVYVGMCVYVHLYICMCVFFKAELLHFNMYTNSLEILLKGKLWFRRSAGGLRWCLSNNIEADTAAAVVTTTV